MCVTRCVCHDVTLVQLKAFADEHACDFAALRREFGCGSGCGLCEPYVRAMLRTGRTSFAVDDPDVLPQQS